MANKRKKKLPSTKNLVGERRNGVLYLKKGVGSGQFWNVHGDGVVGASDHVIPGVDNRQRRLDYD